MLHAEWTSPNGESRSTLRTSNVTFLAVTVDEHTDSTNTLERTSNDCTGLYTVDEDYWSSSSLVETNSQIAFRFGTRTVTGTDSGEKLTTGNDVTGEYTILSGTSLGRHDHAHEHGPQERKDAEGLVREFSRMEAIR